MADASHLERMGRELKCPICLSLLSSAASLTCNHVFCNSCIQKSIRSDSHCPVCKAPVGRREVRPAPHMDNLVNIYKNMEIASGINILMTQNAAPISNPDERKCSEDVAKSSNSDLGRARNKEQTLHKASQSKLKSSGRKPAKTSLRTNKRVQVPKSPLPETPVQLLNSKYDGDGAVNSLLNSKAPNPYSTLKESSNQLLRPLFWLREDDADKPSQQEDGGYKSSQPTDIDLYLTPVETPNFSDIKDSDDDIPDETVHKAEARSKSDVADFFDSEMFEWTQRACSPELCSTPVKMQVSPCSDDERQDEISGMLEGDVASTYNSSQKMHARNSCTVQAVETKISERPTGSKRSRKRRAKSQSKRAKGSARNDTSENMVDGFVPDAECGPAVQESAPSNNGMSAMASGENLTAQAELLNHVGDKVASKLPKGDLASTYNSSGKIHASSTVHAIETKISERPTGSKQGRKGRAKSQSERARGSAGNDFPENMVDGFVPDAECGPAVQESAPSNNGMSAMASRENLTAQAELLNHVGDKVASKLPKGDVASTYNSSGKIHASSTVRAFEMRISKGPTGSKRCRKGRTKGQSKRAKGSAGNDTPDNLVDGFVPDAEYGPADQESAPNNNGLSAMASKENPTVQAKLLNRVGDKVASNLSASSCKDHGHLESMALVNSRNSNIINQCQKKRQAKSKEEKLLQTTPKRKIPSFAKLDQCKEVAFSKHSQSDAGMSTLFKITAEALAWEESPVGVDNLQKSSPNCKPVECVQELKCRGKMEAVNGITDKQSDARISIRGEAVGPVGFDQPLEAGNVAQSGCGPSVITCMFCHSTEETEVSGEMVHYFQGKPVPNDYNGGSHVIHSHKSCTEWAPNVYFEGDVAINVEAELARSRRIKCSLCGVKGAALGCYDKSCRRSFHVPCAKRLKQSRWDTDNFVMLCPLHTSSKLPKEQSRAQLKRKEIVKRQSEDPVKRDRNTNLWNSHGGSNKLHLCCSALVTEEKEMVTEFQRLSGASVSKNWNPTVTHIIASVDENGAFKRTLKVLMGILEGKWILSIEWIKACLEARMAVDETAYELNVDTHGIKGGPCLGRLRPENKQPKLFAGVRFYLSGDFNASYKGYLNDLITSAGGTILHRKPIAEDKGNHSTDCSLSTVIIYSLELPDKYDINMKDVILNGRQAEAEALANLSGSKVASNLWVMNSISGYKLQPLQGSML